MNREGLFYLSKDRESVELSRYMQDKEAREDAAAKSGVRRYSEPLGPEPAKPRAPLSQAAGYRGGKSKAAVTDFPRQPRGIMATQLAAGAAQVMDGAAKALMYRPLVPEGRPMQEWDARMQAVKQVVDG